MWEVAVGAIQYLTGAFKRSHERPERLFRDHVAPIHADLVRIQRDYSMGFRELSTLVHDEHADTSRIVSMVEKRRSELAAVRIATGELAKALAQVFETAPSRKPHRSDSAQMLLYRYAEAVIDYLYGAVAPPDDPDGGGRRERSPEQPESGTRYNGFKRIVEAVDDDTCRRTDLIEIVSDVEKELEKSWATLAERYAVLRARCLM